jgi:hypothetical protein
MRPLESTRRRPRHAVLPSTAGKLHVECSPTLKLGEPGLSAVRGRGLAVVVRVFWAIVGGLRSPKDEGGKSASGARQSRCDVGAV